MKDFTIELDVVILGIAISSSISMLISCFNISVLLLFITNLSMCINFFYAKMHELSTTGNCDLKSVFDLYLHFLTLLPLAFMAISINNIQLFIIANIVLRFMDIVLILHSNHKSLKAAIKYQKQWMIVDGITIVYMSGLFAVNYYCMYVPEYVFSSIILVLWIVDAVVDYTTMNDNYMSSRG
jgi:hypothetical protein